MRNPKQAATDAALRELLGLVTKPLVDRLNVKKEIPSSKAAKQEKPILDDQDGECIAEDGDKEIGINELLDIDMKSKRGISGGDFIEHEPPKALSLTQVASHRIPATRNSRSSRKKRNKREGR